MTRLAAWAALAIVAAAVVGCGPGKELPDEIPKAADPGEKPAAIPAASEPGAKAYVEKAVRAYTGGKPEVVAKGRVSRLVLKGTMSIPIDGQKKPFATTRTITAVWPDRFVATNDLTFEGLNMRIGTWLRGTELTVLEGSREQDLPNRGEFVKALTADAVGQHWIVCLVPVGEPKAVAFDLQSTNATSPQTGQSQAVHLLKLALPDLPLYLLTFDAKTDLLIRVEYTITEQGVRRRKQWSALEHKPGPDGQMVPSKTECRHDGTVVEQWEAEKWEFPATIPDTEFSPKK